jgi:predicted ATPase/class 3 adenylate cyclase
VTFLFTDLETSTRLWEEQPESLMRDALAQHDAIMREAIARHHGVVISMMGDGVAAVFQSAPDAVAAAVDAQCDLRAIEGTAAGLLRARMGLHTDEGRLRSPEEYVNRPLNRCARLMAAAHGGQVLLSDVTAVVARRSLPSEVTLVDLGEHQLRDLAEPMRVFQVAHPLLPADFPPMKSLSTTSGNLPRQVTTFVGRDVELARVSAMVRERPIVTLTGVGGVGKTRLAVQVAAEVVTDFPAGAWLCELAPVSDRDAVWEAVATSLGIQRNPTRTIDDTVIEFLAPRRLLLVVDNCEHLLVEVARIVDAICQQCPNVTVLATSREGLALAGEQLVAVPALGLPSGVDAAEHAERSDAVHLFCDRARDAQPDFALSDVNAGAITQLCRRLDGIPLAIELAAARIRSLPPEDLVTRLDQRFRLLTRGSRAALERHQTLRNTIDWSYDLLGPSEQTALNRLSVFAGGCDLGAAEAIIAMEEDDVDAADLLGQLVDKSLVQADDSGRRVRYTMLETIRQYAQERLEESGETEAVRRRHAEYFVAVSEAAGPHLRGREQLDWSAMLVDEAENLRAALDWAVESGDADHAMRLVAPLQVTGVRFGWTATNWAELAQTIPNAESHHLYPVVAAFAGLGATMRGDLERAQVLVERALESQAALGTEHMWVWTAAGVLTMFQGNSADAQRYAASWEAAARLTGDRYEIAHALILLSSTSLPDDPARSVLLADEAIQTAREAGITSALVYAITLRLNFPLDEASKLQLVDEGIEAATMLGDTSALGGFVSLRGWFAGQDGDWATTLRTHLDGLEGQLQNDMRPWPGIYAGSAVALANLGDPETAAVLWGFAEPQFFTLGGHSDFMPEFVSLNTVLAEELGDERSAELFARGAALSSAAATELVRTAAANVLEENEGRPDNGA